MDSKWSGVPFFCCHGNMQEARSKHLRLVIRRWRGAEQEIFLIRDKNRTDTVLLQPQLVHTPSIQKNQLPALNSPHHQERKSFRCEDDCLFCRSFTAKCLSMMIAGSCVVIDLHLHLLWIRTPTITAGTTMCSHLHTRC